LKQCRELKPAGFEDEDARRESGQADWRTGGRYDFLERYLKTVDGH
jgi:hypothetical protein